VELEEEVVCIESIQEAEGGREGKRERIHESVRECVQERVDNNTGEAVVSKQTQTVCAGLRFLSETCVGKS